MADPGAEGASVDAFWPTVTAFGALWGTVEITLGSFLHALRVPLTGAFLASLGAAILISQRQILPRRGASLATGLVACVCKSVSPGGIILGPMIGISVEAILVELALLALPRGLASAMLAGFLSAFWSISQKVLTQVVVYGADVARLYLRLFEETAEGLGLPDGAGWTALGVVTSVVFTLGATLGALGWSVGREAAARLGAEGDLAVLQTSTGPLAPAPVRSVEPPRYRAPAAVLMVACVALQFGGRLDLSLLATLLSLLLLLLVDRVALRRMWMPRFWAITAIFALGAGLLLGKRETWVLGIPFSEQGLRAGALMVTRGVFVFALASWLSRALRREDLDGMLGRVGGGQLGGAVATAFDLLPALKDRLAGLSKEPSSRPGWKARFLAWRDLSVRLVMETALLARSLQGEGAEGRVKERSSKVGA